MTTAADDRWNIDIKPALAALKKLRASIGQTDKKAAEGFDRSAAASKRARDEMGRFIKTSKSGGASLKGSFGGLNSAIGTVATGLGGLVLGFAAVSAAGVAALAAITAKGIELNKEAEITRIALIQIFEGNEGAADAFIDTIGELAVELGTSRQQLTGFAKGILPDVGTIGGTTELLKNVIILGKDAGAQIDDIRRTLEGALVGDFVGFQDVLNIPPPTIKKIKELSKEIGTAAAITQVLGDRIQEQGLSIEAFAGTLDTLENKLSAQFEDFTRLLAVAPYEELKEQAADLLEVLDKQGPEIEIVAAAFGDLSAKVIEFVGSNLTSFIEGIDFEGVEGFVDGLSDAVDAGELLLGVIFDLGDASSFNNLISALTTVVGKLKEAAKTAAQIIALNKAANARQEAEAQVFGLEKQERFLLGDKLALAIARRASTDEKVAEAATAGEIAYEESLKKSLMSFDKLNESEKENERIRKDRRKVTEDTTEADKAAGEAILARKKEAKELADAQAKAATAQEEISKKTAEGEADRQKKLTDIMRKEADKRFDDAVKTAQKREDIAQKNVDAIEDIFRKNEQVVADAVKDLSQEEQDIARKGARDRRDLERGAANERVDIERNFRQELKRIQDQFNQDAADAERNNDAQAFIAAVRSRDQQVDVATEDRDVSVEEAGINAERQRETLAVSLAAEVEDANIANVQKLEALQARLNQELEAQAIKVQREFEAETIKEQRLKEQRDLALQRQLEAFAQTEAEKQAKLQESLAKQIALVEAAAAKEIEITASAEAQKTAIVQAEAARRQAILAKQAEQRETARSKFGSRSAIGGEREFGTGGRPKVGEPVIVGDRGPEVFLPDQAGTIIPNDTIFSPPPQPSPAGAASMSSVTNNPTFNLAESMFKDPVARRQLTNFVLGVLAEGV